jgi:hypothetical protein
VSVRIVLGAVETLKETCCERLGPLVCDIDMCAG